MEHLSHSEQETEQLGEQVARKLPRGTVIAYTGELGMGKTAFTRGLARGLGCRGRVTSPTFTIVNEYEGDIPLFHFDLYRLGSSDELFDIGWEDYLARGGVCRRMERAGRGRLRRFHRAHRLPAQRAARRLARHHHHGGGRLMKILALETSAKSVSTAVVENGAPLAYAYQCTGLTHSRTLMPMVYAMLKNAELTLGDMDAVAVAAGPGSFTGLRIGIAAVKGLAWAADKPCLGVSTLEAMAQNLAHMDGLLVCAMDARRNQVYNALFEAKSGVLTRLTPDRAIAVAELAEELRGETRRLLVLGDGGRLCRDGLAQLGVESELAPAQLLYQNAVGVGLAAEHGTPVSAQELAPVYLRISQAERERNARLQQEAPQK